MLRRFTRWTLTVLLLGVLSLEIASVWWTLRWQRKHWSEPNHVQIIASRGTLSLHWQERRNPTIISLVTHPNGFSARRCGSYGLKREPGPMNWWSFRFDRTPPTGPGLSIRLPLTYLILALALSTGWLWVGEFRRRRKARAGCCRRCGYDLRGLPGGGAVLRTVTPDESGEAQGDRARRAAPPVCPECGGA